MRRSLLFVTTVALVGYAMLPGSASSHREAPLLSADPQMDSTDVYAFVSPDKPDTVTLMSSWIPFEEPAGGPNFYGFADGAWYDINVDNDGDAQPDYIYRWIFKNNVANPNTFLYNTGPVTALDDPDLNLYQTYTLQVIYKGQVQATVGPIRTLYNNVGAPSTPSFFGNGTGITGFQHPNGGVGLTFAGQTDDPFFLDLRVFNLLYGANLSQVGKDTLKGFNVHSMAVQVPKAALRVGSTSPVIGVWTTSSRQATKVYNADGTQTSSGNFVQVSRLGMPLVNELVIPVGQKDKFSASKPVDDAQFLNYVTTSEVANLLQLIYGVPAPATPRNDLVQVFLTGVPNLNQIPGGRPSEMLRLNTDIPPTAGGGNRLGVLGGDLAGFPNGRRLQDDIVDIAVRVVAGALVGQNVPLGDGVDKNDVDFLGGFPYLGVAHSGAKAQPH
ncbi:MAG: DUF4331 domain-containing protein [Vicinamibacterales bacterium]